MDFFEVLRQRRSIRAFEDRAVEPDKLQQILEAANAAPTAGNLQAFEIIVVSDPALKSGLRKSALNQEALTRAPLDLVFLQDPPRSAATYGTRGTQLYALDRLVKLGSVILLADAHIGSGERLSEHERVRMLSTEPGFAELYAFLGERRGLFVTLHI